MSDNPIPPTGPGSTGGSVPTPGNDETPPPFPSSGPSAGANASGSPYYQGSAGGWAAYEAWMGPQNFAQFMKTLLNTIVNQIGQQRQKEHEAAQQLQKAEIGEDMDDS